MTFSTITMTDTFEKQKNRQASMLTASVMAALFLFFILLKWPMHTLDMVAEQDYIEVNIGTDDFGSGTDQPLLPGDPAQAQQLAYNPPQPVLAQNDDARDIDTDDRAVNVPEVKKPTVVKPDAKKISNDNRTVTTTPTTQPVLTTAPPKPKAVIGKTIGGTGNGGNGADTYQKGTGEGIAGGTGDQGKPGGIAGSPNYNGPRKSFGVRVLQISDQSFEDEFNENAKVAMDVVADANGKVTSASFQAKGSTTNNRNLVDIARRRAFELKLGSSDGGQQGTVIFNFKLRG